MKKVKVIKETEGPFDPLGRFILQDFDQKRPFASFLPGIAGLQGIPMWAFYVNRGQAVASFGGENKDHPMLEFQAANKAYQHTALTGFRTFFNGSREDHHWTHEAFSPWAARGVQRTMLIGMNELEIKEIHPQLGYQISVLYFLLYNCPFSALVRSVRIKNIQDSSLSLEIVDGLPGIVPYGVDNGMLKQIGRTIEAWMQVENIENRLPFYRLKATPGDTAAVHTIRGGNFALATCEGHLLPIIVDPFALFGEDTSHSAAHVFHHEGLGKTFQRRQVVEGRTPCAFFGTSRILAPGEEHNIISLYGFSKSLSVIQSHVASVQAPGFFDQKLLEVRKEAAELTDVVFTNSASPLFDAYSRQTFLDNLLRGGYPLMLGGKHIFHVYARKHGDLERDYNDFVLPPTPYSHGNGNYRDINQNRRNDVFFVPEAGEFNLRFFLSLIQADGYNPLVINGLHFSLPAAGLSELMPLVKNQDVLAETLANQFTPGDIIEAIDRISPLIPIQEFLEAVFSEAEAHIQAEHGEGYWVDHWTYLLDLIEAYLAIFPDKKLDLLFDSDPLPFYDNATVVQPRCTRFVLYQGKARQHHAVIEDLEKAAKIESRSENPHWARAEGGNGAIFRLPVISKLVLLVLLKFATRDPSGMGIQMEAGRPGWYDALNGLPALFGSSMPETYELLRLVRFLIGIVVEAGRLILLPSEAQILLKAIDKDLLAEVDLFTLWDHLTSALEQYRESTRNGFTGSTISVNMVSILEGIQANLEEGIERAQSFTEDIPPTYFIHEATEYDLTGETDQDGYPFIDVTAFKAKVLPLFLEGPVRWMKIANKVEVEKLAQAIEQSDLFDQELRMLKVNASLAGESHEIGRARAFTPGWLENESIWMHMAFKYLLELQNADLDAQFFEALRVHLPAFMNPEIYGRSPLENSSFIVSSVHPDKNLHGVGFVARLSGSTAEFLSMWVRMTIGAHPFRYEDGFLVLAPQPRLPGWLFKEDGTFAFHFLGSCLITYRNPSKLNTYDAGIAIKSIELHSGDETLRIDGPEIHGDLAERVRKGEFNRMDCYF
ncbi:MAG: cellobiose phosphorylase [Anaerolineales bacterium]